MIKHPLLRALLGALLGACAGLSLCLSILPMVFHQARIGDEAALALRLSHFMPHVALIWAVGGWAVSRTRVALGAGLVLATTGLGAGLFLVFAALHPAAKILAVGGVTGLVYGFLGGLLLGRILSPLPDDPEEDG